MLEYYVNKNGELTSGEKDLIVQTSKGVDTILINLPEDYDDSNIVASITFKNPKNVASNSYKMEHEPNSKKLTYLLDDKWFNSVKGIMQFTIRVYSTDVTIKDSVTFDDSTGDIIVNEQSKTQVFTKGSYQILEAINEGSTPEIPEDDLSKIYALITERANKADIYTYVEQVTGIPQSKLKEQGNVYVTIDNRLINVDSHLNNIDKEILDLNNFVTNTTNLNIGERLNAIEDIMSTPENIKEFAQEVYDSNDKTIDIVPSKQALTFTRKNSKGDKNVTIELPQDCISVEYGVYNDMPAVTVYYAETSGKAVQDQYGNVIDKSYLPLQGGSELDKIEVNSYIKFKNKLESNDIELLPNDMIDNVNATTIVLGNNSVDGDAKFLISSNYGDLAYNLSTGDIEYTTKDSDKVNSFNLQDIVLKETPIFCEISIYAGTNLLEIQTVPAHGRHILLTQYNKEICKIFVITQNGQVDTFLQQTGTTIPGLELIVTNVIKVGDING